MTKTNMDLAELLAKHDQGDLLRSIAEAVLQLIMEADVDGLKQEFITPHCPQQNGMVERVIRTLKEQCIHRQRFDSIQHATRAIGDWISFYNHRRPHQALDMKTPAEAFALAA